LRIRIDTHGKFPRTALRSTGPGVGLYPGFSKNRDRLLEGETAAKFLAAVLSQPPVKRLLSSEHFSVDGTLIEARPSLKSFKPKDRRDGSPQGSGRNAATDFRGEKCSNATHRSTTDPDARPYRKGPAGRRGNGA